MRRAKTLYQDTPPGFTWERRDCGVRALRCALGISYEEAHKMLEREGRVPKGMTYDRQMSRVAEPVVRDLLDPDPTLAQFLSANRAGRFIIRTARHYFAIVDGVVHNWNSNSAGARCRVRIAWKQ